MGMGEGRFDVVVKILGQLTGIMGSVFRLHDRDLGLPAFLMPVLGRKREYFRSGRWLWMKG